MLSVFGITLTNDKSRRKNSHRITVRSFLRTHLTLFISGAGRSAHPFFVNRCFLKNEPIILCLTYFYFNRTVLSKKYLEEFDRKSIFQACRQNGSKTEKNFCYSKVTSTVLISHFRGLLIVIFRSKVQRGISSYKLLFFKLTLY